VVAAQGRWTYRHPKDIDNFDQILDDKKELERNLKLKEEEITKLRSTKGSEIASHQLTKEKEIETLRSTKDAEIAKLKTARGTLFEEFQTQFKTWDMGTTKQEELKSERDGLSVKLSEANGRASSFEKNNALLQHQLGELRNEVTEVENKLKTVRGLLSSKERELIGTVKTLEDCQSMLDEERRELGLEYLDHEDLSVNNYLI
jgi:chromosome segregation ATPase